MYEGRGWNVEGGHTLKFNRAGYAISFLGDFMQHSPEDEAVGVTKKLIGVRQKMTSFGAKKTLVAFFKCAQALGKLAPDFELFGHRDANGGTDCPGDQLYDIFDTFPHWVKPKIGGEGDNINDASFSDGRQTAG